MEKTIFHLVEATATRCSTRGEKCRHTGAPHLTLQEIKAKVKKDRTPLTVVRDGIATTYMMTEFGFSKATKKEKTMKKNVKKLAARSEARVGKLQEETEMRQQRRAASRHAKLAAQASK